jgi:lipocalin
LTAIARLNTRNSHDIANITHLYNLTNAKTINLINQANQSERLQCIKLINQAGLLQNVKPSQSGSLRLIGLIVGKYDDMEQSDGCRDKNSAASKENTVY